MSPWTSTGASRSVSVGSLSLTEGQSYVSCVRTRSTFATTSAPVCSDAVVVDSLAPLAPTHTSPTDASSTSSTPLTLVARHDDAAAVSTGQLAFQLCSTSNCSAVVEGGSSAAGIASGASGSWAPTTTATGTYWWRARSTDAAGHVGPWSTPWQVSIVAPATITVSVDQSTISLGSAVGADTLTGDVTVTVASDSPTGYDLRATDQLAWGDTAGVRRTDAGATLPDWNGGSTTPSTWAEGQAGFGLTVRRIRNGGVDVARLPAWGTPNVAGWPADDFDDNAYAAVRNSATTLLHSGMAPTSGAGDEVLVTMRADVPDTQAPGSYQANIVLTATARP